MNKKPYSLLIGHKVLQKIKAGKQKAVIHQKSKRWNDFYKKKHKNVRFFELLYGDSCICKVQKVEIIKTTIRIEIV